MKKLLAPGLVVLAASTILAGAAVAASNLAPVASNIQTQPIAAPTPIARAQPDPPEYVRTGGPYIGERAALERAAKSAQGVVSKQDIRLMTYGDVVAFTGNRTYTIGLDREVYFVVTSATFVGRGGSPTCLSYMAVIDATTGDGFSVICGVGAWPAALPAAFH
jgi:hypothetical protein